MGTGNSKANGQKNEKYSGVHVVKEVMYMHDSPFYLLYHNNNFIQKEGKEKAHELLTELVNNGGKIQTCTSSHESLKIITIWTIVF